MPHRPYIRRRLLYRTETGHSRPHLIDAQRRRCGQSSEEIAESFDYHGAWLQTSASSHYLYVTLYTLNRHLDTCLSLLADIVIRPDFPEKRIHPAQRTASPTTARSERKSRRPRLRDFSLYDFRGQAPLRTGCHPDHISHITTEDLRDYHRQHIAPGKCRIFIAGKITGKLLDNLELHFGHTWNVPSVDSAIIPAFPIHRAENPIIVTHKENALQSGIRMGLPVIGRENPDFFALKLLCTILGGYFGSRLMSNIREEKGYTYGISSSIAAMRYGSYLTISTQTGTEFTRPLINEVFAEIDRLRNEPVPTDEFTPYKTT